MRTAPRPRQPPGRHRRPPGAMSLAGQPVEPRHALAPGLLSGRHPDRQSARRHAARARGAGRRRRDRLRGHPRHPQAARPLRHHDAADALSRAQRRRGAAEAAGAARRRRGGRAGVRCRHAAGLRSRLQAGARGARAGHARDGIARARPRCWRRSRSRACRPTGSSSRASCRRRRRRGARASPSSPAFRRRSCCSRPDRGSPRRSPTSPTGSAPREAAICRELTKLYEEVRRGDLAGARRATTRRAPRPRGEIVIVIAPPGATSSRTPATSTRCCAQALGRAVGQGRGRRGRARHRPAAPRDLSARARARARATGDERRR